MCTGLTIVAGISLLGTIIGTASKVAEAGAQSDALKKQAAADDRSAHGAELMSMDALRGAEASSRDVLTQALAVRGKQRIAFAANNLDPTTGTAAAFQEGGAARATVAANWARLEGARQAYGYHGQSENFAAVASARRSDADSMLTGAYIGAVANLGMGIAQAGMLYGQGAGWFDPKVAGASPLSFGAPVRPMNYGPVGLQPMVG